MDDALNFRFAKFKISDSDLTRLLPGLLTFCSFFASFLLLFCFYFCSCFNVLLMFCGRAHVLWSCSCFDVRDSIFTS